MKYAISIIDDDEWLASEVPDAATLKPGQAFFADTLDNPTSLVLADDRKSLRVRTAAEVLDIARAERMQEASELRKAIINDAFQHQGKWVACDLSSSMDFSEQNDAITFGIVGALPVNWRTCDNEYIEMKDPVEWGAFLQAYAMHKGTTWGAFRAHEQAIKAHPDPTNYDLTAHWPPTRIEMPTS